MGIQDIIEGKKQWRAHMARVKALPPDYQIVYKEIQRYLFRVGPTDLPDGCLLSGIVDFFEEGVAVGKGVRELIGNDVAAFCDDLVKDSRSPSAAYDRNSAQKSWRSGPGRTDHPRSLTSGCHAGDLHPRGRQAQREALRKISDTLRRDDESGL